ncbi:hypothetical protein [Kosakonia sacchari]|uniref:hypothetical protein n=1 Tax=Kosakonia sacchari TaxID=1158459 RepID=UPI003F55AF7B
MTKLKVVNIGPNEWFSPHFAYNDELFETYNFDPIKSKASLITFCNEVNPDILLVFRGDMVRNNLYQLRNIFQIEFSSEIYPTNVFSVKKSEWIATKKFMHCLRNINPLSNIVHYDQSRKKFFEALNIAVDYHFLPVNLSFFDSHCEKDIDLLFFGRASDKRCTAFSHLKESGLKFVWIENGLDWKELSVFISRSKVVINITAEDIDNFEPRVLLALAGGSRVITEPSVGLDYFLQAYPEFSHHVKIISPVSSEIISAYYELSVSQNISIKNSINVDFLSTNSFLKSYVGISEKE